MALGHRITNRRYLQFLKDGIIETISEEQIRKVVDNITVSSSLGDVMQARGLVIMMYYLGARPNEVLRLKAVDFTREGKWVIVKVKASKRGLPRSIYLPYDKPLIKEFYDWASIQYPDINIFYKYVGRYVHKYKNKKGVIKENITISDKLHHHIREWFNVIYQGDSISPYFLRHNRFSKLAEKGADLLEMKMLKGAKTMESVMPYIHMSSKMAVSIAKKMD